MTIYRNMIERSCMSNNDEYVAYTDKELTYDMLEKHKLVFSRPVYDFEIKEGLVVEKGIKVEAFDEEIPKVTRLVDSLYRIKIRFGFEKKMMVYGDREFTLQKAVNHYIAYNYYDCMSGGCPTYILSIFRYIIQNTEDWDMKDEIYPNRDGWSNFEDFMEATKDVICFEDVIKEFQNKLPPINQFLLSENNLDSEKSESK